MTHHRISQRLFFGAIILMLAFTGSVFAQEPPPAETQEETTSAITEFEGPVTFGLGRYFYMPAAKGYDVVVQGMIQGQDAGFLTDKVVRIKGTVAKGEPSVFVADSIEVKDASGQYQTVFTRTEAFVPGDYIDAVARDEFAPLAITAHNKSEEWEGKGKGKIFGKLVDNAIVVRDDRNREIGKILIDNVSDFANYYIQKLKLFDQFWLYINIKDTVAWSERRRSRDLFHADLVLAGLY